MQELLKSKRFRSGWALLSRSELSGSDRAAAINGVIRMLSAENMTLDDLLEAACRGAVMTTSVRNGAPFEPGLHSVGRQFRPGFDGIKVHVDPNPKEKVHATTRTNCEQKGGMAHDMMPTLLIGSVLIDDELSNPRAAYGVVRFISDGPDEWGPLRVYGTDLDAARHAVNHKSRIEGKVMRPSSSTLLPILTEVREVA